MTEMLRVAFHVLALISLALLTLCVVLWVRSYLGVEEWRWRARQGTSYERISAVNEKGTLTVKRYRLTQPSADQSGAWWEGRWRNYGLHITYRVVVDKAGVERPFVAELREDVRRYPSRRGRTRFRSGSGRALRRRCRGGDGASIITRRRGGRGSSSAASDTGGTNR